MSILDVRKALEVELNSMSPALATSWENDEYTPIVGTAYQKVYLMTAQPDDFEFGPVYRQNGVFQITLLYPGKGGVLTANTRAKLIQDTFKRGNTYTNNSVDVIISKTPYIKTGSRMDDRWSVVVDVEYFAHITS